MAGHFIILILFLLIACYYDVRQHRLPNWLNVSGVLVGIIYHLVVNQLDGFIQSVLGLLVAGVILLLLYIFKAVGAGDVKLFAAIGAISGVLFSLYAIMYSIIFAGIIGLIILLFTKTFLINITLAFLHIKESMKDKTLTPLDDFKNNISNRFPFIYAVIPGVITAFYYMYVA
ncbi:prepilin peptidase CpaA [Virgibacillus natechei]|uniref:Prepilin peptidase CpaA n=1 Tax=Virgibacillus natechei TaxID=1216297 RepID=A0ABS4ICI2_9BACI|nr:prepilin peptidase [Virgibacillus natechei]MBP1968652.1 prepilin peptidase CpaA [Virgibacillus natechei]UZD13757.1 prepilin peptidase [Virgibacillus natechei]